MSSIMRARSGLTGRSTDWEVIGGSSRELKVAGPSMLGSGRPGSHALPLTQPKTHEPHALPSRESGFVQCPEAAPHRVGPNRRVARKTGLADLYRRRRFEPGAAV